MSNVRPKCAHLLPRSGTACLRRICQDVRVDSLPVLHLSINGDQQLKAAGRGLILCPPKILDHDGRGGGDARAERLGGDPAGAGISGPPEELHLLGVGDGYDVEVTPAVCIVYVETNVRLDERRTGLGDGSGRGDLSGEGPVTRR